MRPPYTFLKGNRRVVYEQLRHLLEEDLPVSHNIIADRANCDPRTVSRSLRDLQAWGLVRRRRRSNGHRAEYELCLPN